MHDTPSLIDTPDEIFPKTQLSDVHVLPSAPVPCTLVLNDRLPSCPTLRPTMVNVDAPVVAMLLGDVLETTGLLNDNKLAEDPRRLKTVEMTSILPAVP